MCPVQHFKEMRPSCQGYIGGTEGRWCTDISRFLGGKRWEQQAIQASTTSSNSTYKSWYHVIAHCHPAIIQLKNKLIPPKMASPMPGDASNQTSPHLSLQRWRLEDHHWSLKAISRTTGVWCKWHISTSRWGHLPIVTHALWHDL